MPAACRGHRPAPGPRWVRCTLPGALKERKGKKKRLTRIKKGQAFFSAPLEP